MIPPIIFLFIGLTSGAIALISFSSYRKAKIPERFNAPSIESLTNQNSSPSSNQKETEPEITKKSLEKAVQEITKPIIEENVKLKKKLDTAETLFKDVRAAKRLAPETNQQGEN